MDRLLDNRHKPDRPLCSLWSEMLCSVSLLLFYTSLKSFDRFFYHFESICDRFPFSLCNFGVFLWHLHMPLCLSVVLWWTFRQENCDSDLQSYSFSVALTMSAGVSPAADVLLVVFIFLRWLWSSSCLVLLHYPHASCLHWNTHIRRSTKKIHILIITK